MALFYDPITDEAGPSRTWEEEEDEFEELHASKGSASFTFMFLPDTKRLKKSDKLEANLLMVGASLAGGALLEQLGQAGQAVGLIKEESSDSDEGKQTSSKRHSESLGRVYALQSSGRTVVLVPVQEGIQPESAVAWTRAFFSRISAARVVVLGSLPRSRFLGATPDAAARAIYLVETTAQRALSWSERSEVQYLPTGNLVDGVAAAVLSHCQVRNKVATLLVNIDQTTGPDGEAVGAVVTSVKEALASESLGLDIEWSDIVARSRADLRSRSRKQSWSELYS